jgi:magnesium chelatase family protein
MESGDITVARGDETITLPARSILVFAANPCPCGNAASGTKSPCRCSAPAKREYIRRIEGPVADRIDILRTLRPWQPHDAGVWPSETTAEVRARVLDARGRQASRYAGRGWRLNGELPGAALRTEFVPAPEVVRDIEEQVYAGALSRRGAVRVQRLAWTVADLFGHDRPGREDGRIALALRLGHALPAETGARRSA